MRWVHYGWTKAKEDMCDEDEYDDSRGRIEHVGRRRDGHGPEPQEEDQDAEDGEQGGQGGWRRHGEPVRGIEDVRKSGSAGEGRGPFSCANIFCGVCSCFFVET